MLYQIRNDYYVKVGSKYFKVLMNLDKKGELIMKPTNEKIESKKGLIVKEVDFNKEKERIIRSLKPRYSMNND